MIDFDLVPAAVAVIARRRDYLRDRVTGRGFDERHRSFDEREVRALELALASLELIEMFRREETDPVASLEELCDLLDEERDAGSLRREIEDGVVRSRQVLAMAQARIYGD